MSITSSSSSLAATASADNAPFCVAALYRFTHFDTPAALQRPLQDQCAALDICGTLLLAREGINGTVAGTEDAIRQLITAIRALPGCAEIDVKYSTALERPFARMKVRLKKEIVTMGVPDLDPTQDVGIYVEPQDWNALLDRPDMVLIDTRNDYEVEIGTFAGAIDPRIKTFREFPGWFAQMQDQWKAEGKPTPPVAMFCTGGIRCEKSTALARHMGIEEVYHLKGGILKYLEDVPQDESKWQGNCFVFDERVSVTHGLALTQDQTCQQCGFPFGPEDAHRCSSDGDWHRQNPRQG
ncbi:MAG: rhodanese-related sulfurtransferase [Sphingobium sp.]|nr:rhodanese-related sulfurtransferase [Sphingobium sp.]